MCRCVHLSFHVTSSSPTLVLISSYFHVRSVKSIFPCITKISMLTQCSYRSSSLAECSLTHTATFYTLIAECSRVRLTDCFGAYTPLRMTDWLDYSLWRRRNMPNVHRGYPGYLIEQSTANPMRCNRHVHAFGQNVT